MPYNTIRGSRALRRLLKRMDAFDRVRFALQLATGEVQYIPSTREACERVGVAESYARTFRRLSEEERGDLYDGLKTLGHFHNARRTNGHAGVRYAANQIPDEALDSLVSQIGTGRVRNALVRSLKPAVAAE